MCAAGVAARRRQVLRRFADRLANDGAEEMRARHVHVSKIGAVGLVQVVVHFEDGRVCGCYYGLEEGGGWNGGRLEVDVVEVGAEEADLFNGSIST